MPRDGVESHEHVGSYGAYVAYATIQPSRDVAVGVFTNIGGGQDLRDAVAGLGTRLLPRFATTKQTGLTQLGAPLPLLAARRSRLPGFPLFWPPRAPRSARFRPPPPAPGPAPAASRPLRARLGPGLLPGFSRLGRPGGRGAGRRPALVWPFGVRANAGESAAFALTLRAPVASTQPNW